MVGATSSSVGECRMASIGRWPLVGVLYLFTVICCCVMASGAVAQTATWHKRSAHPHGLLLQSLLHTAKTQRRDAHVAVLGGRETAIESEPWQVVVFGYAEGREELCGGSILDMNHILTAGYCMHGPAGTLLPPSDFFVGAGTSNAFEPNATAEARLVTAVRVHPYFQYSLGPGAPDDVAVLTLSSPLDVSAAIKSIAMASTGSSLSEGSAVGLAGFGERQPIPEENGKLYSLKLSTVYSRECGGEADGLFVCASTSTGSACGSDIGGGLTSIESTPALVGVTDLVHCSSGSLSGFANVVAPEIRDFIEGSESPPQAPRGGGVEIEGVVRTGHPLTCIPGTWSNGPAFTYVFENSSTKAVLQAGVSPTYQLSSANVGQSILCEVQASNAGGTGIGRTPGIGPIQESPPPPVPSSSGSSSSSSSTGTSPSGSAGPSATQEVAGFQAAAAPPLPDAQLASTALVASLSGIVSVKVSCPAGESSCSGTVTLRTLKAVVASLASAAKSKGSILTLATGSFTVAGGKVTTVKLHLSAKARALLARSHVLRARATIVAHDPVGASHTTQIVVTLRAASARRGKA